MQKANHSLSVSNTFRNNSLSDDRKAKQYVEKLHRYLNVNNKEPSFEQPTLAINWLTETQHVQPRKLAAEKKNKRKRKQVDMVRARYNGTNIDAFYCTPRAPGSFSGVRNLRRYSGRATIKAKKFLSGRDAYTMHKPRRIRFPRRKTYSKGIRDLYQIDLADVFNLSPFNDGMRYLLTCINVFTKRAWAIPIKAKSARGVADAFEKIADEGQCNMVQSDKGTEFLNSTFQSMLQRRGIHFYTSENEDLKASVVERFNRTLKTKMYRYFTRANTRKYVDVLDDLMHSYNNTYHR